MSSRPLFAWQEVECNGDGPGPRSRHGLVYDRTENALILFGGIDWKNDTCLNDTWQFQRGRWSPIDTPISPPRRHRGAMVFDTQRGCCVLFGGQTPSYAPTRIKWPMLGDTWLFSQQQWHKLPGFFRRRPSARCGHAMAYDESSQTTLLFGGIDPLDRPLGDTWTFDGSRWRKLKCKGPAARRYAALAYHPGMKGCLLHGGAEDDNGRVRFGDSWLFADGKWTALGSDFQTDPRDDHALGYHEAAGTMVMLDGLLRDPRGQPLRQVLVMAKNGWRQVEVSPLDPRHQCSPLAYDASLGGLVLHGGEAAHGGPQMDQTLVMRLG